MKTCISFPFIYLFLLCCCAFSSFSPLYGQEGCGLTSKQANVSATQALQKSMSQSERLPVIFNAGFYDYYIQYKSSSTSRPVASKYFGFMHPDGTVYLMTYNESATQLQFAPYDPLHKSQDITATNATDSTFFLSFTGQSGDNAAIGAAGQLVNVNSDLKAGFRVFKYDVGYVEYNGKNYEYDRIWLVEKDPEPETFCNLDVVWEGETPVLKRMNTGDYCNTFRKESSMIQVWATDNSRTVRCLSYHDGDGKLIRQDNLFPDNQKKYYTESLQQNTADVLSRTAARLIVPEGYDFLGWNTEADGSGATYAENSIYRGLTNEMVDLYALNMIWQVQYGKDKATARFTATKEPAVYQAQISIDPSMASGSGGVEISLL